MTNPPSGGSVSPPTSPGAGTTTSPDGHAAGGPPDGDFGATTLSGRTITEQPSRPDNRPATERPAGGGATGATRTDLPPMPSTGTAAPGSGPGGTGGPAGQPGPAPDGAPTSASGIRGIRTGRNRGPRRARLQIRHVNPMTVLKFSCVLSIALFFVWLIIIGVLFGILDAAGVIGRINDTVTQLNGSGSKPPVTSGVVFGGAAIVGVINIVLFIALSTIGAVIYNLCADLVGGIEITLSER